MSMKDEYHHLLKGMSLKELDKEKENIEMELMKANSERKKGSNPYHKGGFQIRILKWKRVQVIVEKAIRKPETRNQKPESR